jgi:ATP-dependent Clp protease adapter protein ClpS
VSDELRKSTGASEGSVGGDPPPGGQVGPKHQEPSSGSALPRCNVVLRGASGDDMLQVVRALIEVGGLDKERALEAAFEAQMAGIAIVLVTHRERAELYQDQFLARGVRVMIEPA